MSDSQIVGGSSPNPPSKDEANDPGETEPDAPVAEALARVHEAVSDVTNGELRESLEAAIEAIDSVCGTPDRAEGDELAAVADAMEGALHELERGKVANLLPVIEQAQSIVQSGTSEV
jgi:hypothetical protein